MLFFLPQIAFLENIRYHRNYRFSVQESVLARFFVSWQSLSKFEVNPSTKTTFLYKSLVFPACVVEQYSIDMRSNAPLPKHFVFSLLFVLPINSFKNLQFS